MEELKIKFQHNWNGKLDKGIFTTIRKYEGPKFNYYIENVNKLFNVELNGTFHSSARLIDVAVQNIHWMPYGLLATDTGLTDRKEIMDLFAKFGCTGLCILLTFSKVVDNGCK